jgi:2-keto-4-pentenoate hydratase
MTLNEAYRRQMERADALAGHKAGCVSPAMQAQLGIDRPVFGRVYAAEVYRAGVRLEFHHYDGLAIEGEIAVRLACDVPDPKWLAGCAIEAVASAFVVIELHHYAQRETALNAPELIASNCIHAGVVLPEEEPALQDARVLVDEPVSVYRNSELLGVAGGDVLPGGPLASVARLAEHLEQYGQHLRQGQIVLTGSPLPLYRVAVGDRIDVVGARLGGRAWTIIDR